MIKIIDLGKTEYLECLDFQKELFQNKIKGEDITDYILITEHFPVYTKGKTTKEEHLLNVGKIPVVEIERGGSVTFHGEGQIVVYPILSLKNYKFSVRKYVYTLEEIMIESLKEIGIEAFRKEKLIGIFTEKGKIGFIGVRISKNTTMHGFSINVDVDKKYFQNIIPCGLSDIPVVSISDFKEISKDEFKNILISKIENKLKNSI